ncbi:DUF5677 domain-containing protein [Terrabacter terrigena]|uniref:DUF5677 domain-containing protein n=1 Tax=Terrabacter terrigena TaxID=574718 RepID=A0ABW3MZD4_9MICO
MTPSSPMSLDLRAVHDELLAKWDEFASNPQTLRGRRRDVVPVARFTVVFGLASHVHETSRILRHAAAERVPPAALSLVRVMYECGLTAAWAANVEDADDAMVHEHSRNAGNLKRTLAKSQDPRWRDLAETVADADEASPTSPESAAQARYFERLCEDLDDDVVGYGMYRQLSQYSHASVRLVDEYVDLPDDSNVASPGSDRRPALQPSGKSQAEAYYRLALTTMVWSARAVTLLAPDPDFARNLRRIARKLEVKDVLGLSHGYAARRVRAARAARVAERSAAATRPTRGSRR